MSPSTPMFGHTRGKSSISALNFLAASTVLPIDPVILAWFPWEPDLPTPAGIHLLRAIASQHGGMPAPVVGDHLKIIWDACYETNKQTTAKKRYSARFTVVQKALDTLLLDACKASNGNPFAGTKPGVDPASFDRLNNKLNQLYGRLDHFSTPFDMKLDQIRTDMDDRLDQLSSRIDSAVGHSSRYGMATPAQSPTVQRSSLSLEAMYLSDLQ